MRVYVMAVALLFLFVACKGDEKKPEAAPEPAVGGPSGPKIVGAEAPPTGRVGAEAPPTGETGPDPAVIVDRAIEAAGGLELLMDKFAAFTLVSRGLYLGMPYDMTTAWRSPDRMIMTIHSGEMQMGYVGVECWNVMNGVVMDCLPDEAKTVPAQFYVTRLQGLFPLKDPAIQLTYLGPGEVNGKATDAVQVDQADAPVSVRMEFYKDTGLLARIEYAGSFRGAPGQVILDILTYREIDGIQVARKSILTAGGKRFIEDMLVSISWEVDAAVFERPQQRALGVPAVRKESAHTVAYVLHKGAYEELGATLGGMMTWAVKAGLDVMGAPTFVYLSNPGDNKDPASYLTEIRIPVTAAGDLTAAHRVYKIKRVEETTVATRLEKGPYDKAAAAFGPLASWCTEKGYVIAGPPMMTGYSDPSRTPPEELLNEIRMPVRKVD